MEGGVGVGDGKGPASVRHHPVGSNPNVFDANFTYSLLLL